MSEVSADVFEGELVPSSEPPIKPLNIMAMSDEDKATVGHALEKEIQNDSQELMARYLRIGRNLYVVMKNDIFKQLGYDSFDEWRAQPEMKISRATAYALVKVFEVFIEKLKVDYKRLEGIDWTKLYAVSQFVNSENVEEYLEKASSLSRTDLQREMSLARAKAKGVTPEQAEAQVAVLDVLREACPIGCGAGCQIINNDNDAAVESFKKFLGKWKSLQSKIKSLYGKTLPVSKPAP